MNKLCSIPLSQVVLPYVPASTNQVENVLKALSLVKSGGKLIDLGSGDGRIVNYYCLFLLEKLHYPK